jgi:hypothetical protein
VAFGSGEGREIRSVARRDVEQGLTAFDWNMNKHKNMNGGYVFYSFTVCVEFPAGLFLK